MDLCIRHVFEDARNQWGVLADGVAVDLGLEVFAGGFHAGDLAEEGYLLFAVGQLGHAAFGQTDLAHEAHVQQSGEKLSGVALLLRRGRTQLYCGGTAIHANTSSRHVGLHRLRTVATVVARQRQRHDSQLVDHLD